MDVFNGLESISPWLVPTVLALFELWQLRSGVEFNSLIVFSLIVQCARLRDTKHMSARLMVFMI